MANKKYSFSEEEIRSAASEASSRTEMMRILGIRQGGGGYQALDFWCRKYDIVPPDGRHLGFRNIEKYSWKAMGDDEWFVNGTRRQGPHTRARLVRSGVPDICSECGQPPVWNDKPLTLQIDHINGDHWDNRKENIRILCPHCHTQTETYANTGSRKARYYCECGKEIWKGSIRCIKCSNEGNAVARETSVDWPPVEEVVKQIKLTNFRAYAKVLGCSDNAIRKFLTRNGMDLKNL